MSATYETSLMKQIWLRTALASAIILAPLWLLQALHFLALVPSHHINILLFLYITLLLLPSALAIVLPITCCLSILSIYQMMNMHFESVVLSSFGLKPLKICKPALLCGLICTALGYLLSLYVTPLSWRTFHAYENDVRSRIVLSSIPTKVFTPLTPELTLYVDKVEHNEVEGVVLYDAREPEKHTTVFAKFGEIIGSKNNMKLRLYEGSTQRVVQGNQLTFFKFNHLDFALPNIQLHKNSSSLSDLSIMGLLKAKSAGEVARTKVLSEIGARLTTPLYNLIYILIITCALVTNLRFKDLFKVFPMPTIIAVVSVMICVPMQFALTAFSRSNETFLMPLFVVPIVLIAGCMAFLKRGVTSDV